MKINGKHYPLWGQFVKRKKKWIGGILEDFEDSMDKTLGYKGKQGIITDIKLEPNGEDSAFFSVVSDKFTCGFDVRVGGVCGGEKGWITFSGYGGHVWKIKQKENKKQCSYVENVKNS